MKKFTILLPLSGSRSSERACEFSWSIVEKCGGAVTAQHVVDSYGAMQLLGCHEPGLIGSGPYASALESVLCSQRSIADKLLEKYRAVYASSTDGEIGEIIDEGDPFTEIMRRSADFDLVVMGRSSGRERDGKRSRADDAQALDERMADSCPAPLLIVNKGLCKWATMKMLISPYEQNLSYLRSSYNFAMALGKELHVAALYMNPLDVDTAELEAKVRGSLPGSASVRLAVRILRDRSNPDNLALFHHCNCGLNIDVKAASLLIVPTRMINDVRMTIVGLTGSQFINATLVSPLLFWPEEFVFPKSEQSQLLSKMHELDRAHSCSMTYSVTP